MARARNVLNLERKTNANVCDAFRVRYQDFEHRPAVTPTDGSHGD